jgi:hypothetical protein
MKSVRLFSAFFFFFALFFVAPQLHASTSGKGKIVIVITSKTSQLQLDSIKTVMAAQGMEMDIEGTIYSKGGQLKSISGSIVFSPKQTLTFKSDNVGTITITKKGSTGKIEVVDTAPVQ